MWSQTVEALRPQKVQIGFSCITSARILRHALELYGPSLKRGLFANGRGLIFGSGFFGMGAKLGTKKKAAHCATLLVLENNIFKVSPAIG